MSEDVVADDLKQALARKASFLQTMRAVAWSFFGVRKASEHQKDVDGLNPLHVVIAGVIGAILLVVLLLLVVNWVTSAPTGSAAH